jgi:ubiquitin carboxyl-terminal hydrolase 8
MGSIADRMKALKMGGMDVGSSSKRLSKDLSPPQSTLNGHKGSGSGGGGVTSGAGNYGVARTGTSSSSGHQGQNGPMSPHGNGHTHGVHTSSNGTANATASGSRSRASSGAESIAKPTRDSTRSRSGSTATVNSPTTTKPPVAPKPVINQVHQHHDMPPPPVPQPSSHANGALPLGKEKDTSEKALRQFPTGSSISSTHVNVDQSNNGNIASPPASAGPSKPPLPPIPTTKPGGNSISPQQPSGISAFERAFPSLSDFGKQFDSEDESKEISGLPNAKPKLEEVEEEETITFPQIPSFPVLPSVPTGRPGLASPSSGFSRPSDSKAPDFDPAAKTHSPPDPDPEREVARPSSQPNLSVLDGTIDGPDADDVPQPLKSLDPSPLSPPPSSSSNGHRPLPSLSFPTPQPARAPEPSRKLSKPKFPYSNSVTSDQLRTYFHNPAVELILIDVRPEEEYQRGQVGQEYEGRGAKFTVVYMDPTVLMRNE